MKIGEFRDLGADELKQREKDLDDQLFRLRIQKSMGQLEAAGKLKSLRRDLARILTLLTLKNGDSKAQRKAAARKPAAGPAQPAAQQKDQP